MATEARRLRQFARPLQHDPGRPPVPPPLPPGSIIELPGRGEVFVRDTGDSGQPGLPVLLLHGWTASADLNFFTAYDELARSRRVIALDHRGHGRGMRSTETFRLEDCADDAAALLRRLDVPHVVAVGYSMGGPIALLLAHRHPDLVVGLVAQATAMEWRATWYERLVWRGLSVFELGLRLGTGEGFVERLLREAVEVRPELESLRPWLAAEFRRGLARELADAGRALSRFDARPWAGELGVPAAAVVTTKDRLVRRRKQRQLAAALHATVFELAGDHDTPLVHAADYSRLTAQAVAAVDAAVSRYRTAS